MRPPVKKICAEKRIRGFIKMMKNRTSRNVDMDNTLPLYELNDFYLDENEINFGYLTVFGDMSVSEAVNMRGHTRSQINSYYNQKKGFIKSYVIKILRKEFEEMGGGGFDEEYAFLSRKLSSLIFPKLRQELQFHGDSSDDE